jgi:hypothetical protein
VGHLFTNRELNLINGLYKYQKGVKKNVTELSFRFPGITSTDFSGTSKKAIKLMKL